MVNVYIDGASLGNPGESGIGVFINNNGTTIKHFEKIGVKSNHEAEWQALVTALEICLRYKFSLIILHSDSKIVVDSLDKKYVKNEVFKPYLESALRMLERFETIFIKWIPSNENKADELAKQAIHQKL